MITKTDRKLLFILCITVVVLVLAKCMTSEGYTLKPVIKFNWRNTTTDDITKWTIKLTGNVGNGVTTLETKVIKKEDNPEYFKPFQSNEVTFQPQEFTLNSIKSGLKVEVYYNDGETLYTRKTVYLKKNINALELLQKKNYKFIIITNQAGVSKKFLTKKKLNEIHKKMRLNLLKLGIKITEIYVCTHQDSDKCFCRKPKPGLLLRAAKDHKIDLKNSFFIGDSITDIEAANAAGCNGILLENNSLLEKVERHN